MLSYQSSVTAKFIFFLTELLFLDVFFGFNFERNYFTTFIFLPKNTKLKYKFQY